MAVDVEERDAADADLEQALEVVAGTAATARGTRALPFRLAATPTSHGKPAEFG